MRVDIGNCLQIDIDNAPQFGLRHVLILSTLMLICIGSIPLIVQSLSE